MRILQSLHDFLNQPAQKLTRIDIAPEQVIDFKGFSGDTVANGTYVRIWVSEVYVKDAMRWTVELFPFANGSATMIPPEQNPNNIQTQLLTLDRAQMATKGVFNSFAITSLMPFRGGTLEINAELVKLTGTDYLRETLDILQGFSSIASGVADSTIKIAQNIKNGINRLYNVVDGEVVLAFKDTYTDDNLKAGYIAIIDAPQGTYQDNSFVVKKNRLNYPDEHTPFEDANHLLIRIELRDQHEDWTAISAIKTLVDQACSYYERGKSSDGDTIKPAISEAIRTTPSLTELDRARVKQEVSSYIKNCTSLESYSGDIPEIDGDAPSLSPSEFLKLGE